MSVTSYRTYQNIAAGNSYFAGWGEPYGSCTQQYLTQGSNTAGSSWRSFQVFYTTLPMPEIFAHVGRAPPIVVCTAVCWIHLISRDS